MSNFPTIEKTLETLLNHIITLKPPEREALAKPALQAFTSHPTIQPLLSLGNAPAHNSAISNTPALSDIQKTLTALSKAIEGIQKPSTTPSKKQPTQTPGKDSTKTALRSYSAVAGVRPPNPSLVVDLAHLGIAKEDRLRPEILCDAINKSLGAISPPQVKLVAVRWTAKGNLVVTGNTAATTHSLQLAAPHISNSIITSLQLPPESLKSQPRPNVKWSKLLVNGVPMGALKSRAPFSPDACHNALAANNPSYTSLSITQKPSWVRPPSSYSPGSVSSLTLAFEDPDGSKLKTLLAERYLYFYGNRASVKKWKQRPNNNKDKSDPNTTKHGQGGNPGEKDAVDPLTSPATPPQSLQSASAPVAQSSQPTRRSTRPAKPLRPYDA